MKSSPLQLEHTALTQREFEHIRQFLYEEAGIFLSDIKKSLVASRLCRRLKETGYENYGDYFEFVKKHSEHIEYHHFIDALTTNETFFFREIEHFEFVKHLIKTHPQKKKLAGMVSSLFIWRGGLQLSHAVGGSFRD
ncbi:MAG: hypothetical protein LRY74_03935 [Shewanella xiamenensis]|nr:hypothetical protein [Shewanella xiamenensis]